MNSKQNISIPQGDTPTIVIPITTADNSAFDGSTAEGFYTIAASAASGATVYLTKSTTASPPTASFNLNETTGDWELWAPLTKTDTKALPATSGAQLALYHEAAVIEASGVRSTVMSGAVTVVPTIIMDNEP